LARVGTAATTQGERQLSFVVAEALAILTWTLVPTADVDRR
jgi:hypothetical protein